MAELNLGTLAASLIVKDLFSSALGSFTKAIENIGGPLPALVGGLVAVTGAAAAMTATIVALGERGSEVNDITESFEALNASLGNSPNALSAIEDGLAGTVSKFDIMKSANVALAQGLKLTDTQFKLLGEASRVVADQMGTSNLEAFNSINTAMATGRDRGLKLMGIHVDSAKALENYAHSVGRATSELTANQTLEAKRLEILRALAEKLVTTGKAQDDFSDRLARAKVAVSNFSDGLASAVASSPAVNMALDAISKAIIDAFGKNQTETIKILVGYVNDFAIILVKTASVGVYAAQIMSSVWSALNIVFDGLASAVAQMAGAQIDSLSKVIAAASSIPIIGGMFKDVAVTVRQFGEDLTATGNVFAERAREDIKLGAARVGVLDDTRKGLDKLAVGMRKAADEQGVLAQKSKLPIPVLKAEGDAMNDAAVFAKALASANQELSDAMAEGLSEYDREIQKITSHTDSLLVDLRARKDLNGAQKQEIRDIILATEKEKLHWAAIRHTEQITRDYLAAEAKAREKALKQLDEIADAMQTAADMAVMFGVSSSNAFVQIADGAAVGIKAYIALKKEGASALEKAQAIAGAAQSAYKSGSVLQGAATGAAAGSAFGPWGIVIGAVAGGVLAFAGAASKARAEILKLKDQVANSYGSFAMFTERAKAAGIELNYMLDSKKPKDYAEALKEIEKQLKAHDEAWEKTKAAAEKYGFTIQELGPKFAQQMLVEHGMQVYESWKLLVGAGVDVSTVTQKMSADILVFAREAMATGQAIPMAMKPMIDSLIASGLLLDANGMAFKSAEDAGITFAESLDEKFKTLIESIQEMVDALNGIHPKSIDIPINFVQNTTSTPGPGGMPQSGPTNSNAPTNAFAPGEPTTKAPMFATGSGGFQDFGSGLMAMLHGVEAVVTQTQWDSMLARASSTGAVRIASPSAARKIDSAVARNDGVQEVKVPVVIAGRQIDEIIVKRTRGGFIPPPGHWGRA